MVKFTITYEGNLRTKVIHTDNRSVLWTDAPKDNHGRGEDFSPTDLVGVALGSCVLTLMGITAQKLQVDLAGLRATVEKEMTPVPSRRIKRLIVHVYCPKLLDPETKSKIERAGIECPVHHSLHPDVQQEMIFHWGEM